MMSARGSDRVGRDDVVTGRSEEDRRQHDGPGDREEPRRGDRRRMGAEPPELRSPTLGQLGRKARALCADAVQRRGDEG
jgi:hypothetical protein